MTRPLCSFYAGVGALAAVQALWLPALVLVIGAALAVVGGKRREATEP